MKLIFIIEFILSFKIIFLFINISIIIINIYFLIFKNFKKKIEFKEYKEKYFNQIKNSDFFPLCFSIKNYFEISNYLNSKYDVKKSQNRTTNSKGEVKSQKERKTIVLYSVDLFSFSHHKEWLKYRLEDKFIIKFDSNNPDYLIYNAFGFEHLNPKYNNSIKMFIIKKYIPILFNF